MAAASRDKCNEVYGVHRCDLPSGHKGGHICYWCPVMWLEPRAETTP